RKHASTAATVSSSRAGQHPSGPYTAGTDDSERAANGSCRDQPAAVDTLCFLGASVLARHTVAPYTPDTPYAGASRDRDAAAHITAACYPAPWVRDGRAHAISPGDARARTTSSFQPGADARRADADAAGSGTPGRGRAGADWAH